MCRCAVWYVSPRVLTGAGVQYGMYVALGGICHIILPSRCEVQDGLRQSKVPVMSHCVVSEGNIC